ncbi:MAG: transporter [Burkholderiales bacterium]|jgi:sugar porter (SP) family MFS transporter|nr:transporter [Burkholderiales bacterium]
MQIHKLYLYISIIVAAMSGLLFGFDTSIIAGSLSLIRSEFNASDFALEIVVSFCTLGALFGALVSGYITDKFGRRVVLIITGLLFIFGTVMAYFSVSIFMLICARFILGLAIGVGSFAAPLFIAEIAPAKSRGQLVLFNGAFITGGQVIAFFVSYTFTQSGHWRSMMLSGIVPAILLTLGILCMPESPKWLIHKGKYTKALKVLRKVRDKSVDIQLELQQIKNMYSRKKVSLKEIIGSSVRPVLIIGLFMGICQQFMGINTIMYYGPQIMTEIGLSSGVTAILATLGVGTCNFLFTIITLLLIDHIGRRKFLLIGSFIAAISLFAMIFLINHKTPENLVLVDNLSLICIFCYIIGYCISLGSLFWLMIAEIFPMHIRATCMGVVVAVQWLANFIVSATFLTILHGFGLSLTFSLYGMVSLIVFILSYFKIPETRGVTMEQIEANIKKGLPTRYLGI